MLSFVSWSRRVPLLMVLCLSSFAQAADPSLILTLAPDTGTSTSDFITSSVTPTFRGTADPGSSVQLFSGTPASVLVAVGPAGVATASGAWSIALVTPLASGSYVFEARATPVGGGAAIVSAQRAVVIDNSGASPTIAAITPALGQAGYTNSLTPTISGVADRGATVIIILDGVAVGTTIANATTGIYQYTTGSLVNTDYIVGVQQRDLAGNAAGTATTTSLVVDTRISQPFIYRSTVGVAGTITNDATPGFTGKAEPLSTVSLRTGSALGPEVGTTTADALGNWSLAGLATAVADGPVSFVAVASDAAGNQLATTSFALVIDTIPPVNLAESGFTVTATGVPTTNPSSERALTWSGTVTNAESVAITLDGVAVGSVPVVGGAWHYDFISQLPDHTYTLSGSARDAAGNNAGPVSAAITVHNLLDTPAARLTPVILDAISQPVRTSSSSSVAFTAVGKPSATASVVYTVVTPGVEVGPFAAAFDSQGKLAYTSPTLADGTYDIRVEFTSLGTTYSSAPLQVVIDTVAPSGPTTVALSIDSGVSAGDDITNDTLPDFTVSGATDAAPSSGGLTITTQLDGTDVVSHLVVGGGISFAAPFALPDGTYGLNFTFKDAAGNSSSTVVSGTTIVIDTVTDIPLLTGITPDTGRYADDTVTNQGIGLHLLGRAEAGATVVVSIAGPSFGSPQTVTATASGTGVWNASLPTLGIDGVHTCTATVTDVAGNTAGPSAVFQMTFDATVPPVTITSFSPNTGNPSDNRTNATSITISGTTDADADVSVALNGGIPQVVRADGAGAWSALFTGLADGTYSVSAVATDVAGNIGTTAVSANLFVIDTVVATPSLTTLTVDSSASGLAGWASDFRTTDQTLLYAGDLSGTPVAGTDTLELLINGSVVSTQTLAASATTWAVDRTATTQAEGSYTLMVRVTDDVGNTASASRTLVVDLTAPTATVTSISVDSGVSATDFNTSATTLTAISGGTADARRTGTALVEIVDPGLTVIYSATVIVDGASTWTVSGATGAPALNSLVLTGTPATTYTIRVTPTDAVGNVGAPSVQSLVIDDQPPGVATASIDSFSINSGAATGSTSGSVTSDATPTLSGSTSGAPTDGYVTIYADAGATTVLGTALLSAGSWTFTSPSRVDGTAQFFAKVFDRAGNAAVSLSSGFDIVIDTLAPATAIVAITDDTFGVGSSGTTVDFLTADAQPVFSGTVSDLHLATAASSVKVSLGAIFTAVDATFGGGLWTLDRSLQSAIPDGTYTLTVVATDDVANVTALTRTVIIDTTVAAPTQTLSAGSDTGSSSSDQVTKDSSPTMSGTAEIGAGLTVVFTPATGTPVTVTTQADGSGVWSVTPAVLADGQWTVTATQIDRAGNGPSPAASTTLTIDTVVPVAPGIALTAASDTGISNSDHNTSDTTPTFSSTAEPFARVTVTCTKGSTVVTLQTDADASGLWTVTTGVLATGTWTVVAKQADLAGNGPSPAATLAPALVIDTASAAPTVRAISTDSARSGSDAASLASATDFRTNDTTLTISGTGEVGATVTLSRSASIVGTAIVNGSGAWNVVDPTIFVHGNTPSYSARQVDLAGNLSAVSTTKVATIDTLAPEAPVIATIADITAADASTGITRDQTLVLSGTAEALSLVTVLVDGSAVGTVLANGSGAWTYGPTANLAEGTHLLRATATDVAGNVSALSSGTVITVDLTPPPAPVVTRIATADDTGISSSDLLTNLARPTLSGSGTPGTTLILYEGATAIGTTVVAGDGSWSVTPNVDFTAGSHAVTATATDLAGNVSAVSAALTITVDLTVAAPVIGTISTDSGSSATDAITNDTSLTIAGTGEIGATIALYEGGNLLGTTLVGAGGTWTFATLFSEATHVVTAVATDRAGNQSLASTGKTIIVDLTAPSAVVTAISVDTGASPVDGLTNDAGLVFTGTTEALAIVTLRLDGVLIGTTTAGLDGTWSYDHSAVSLASGTYQVTATATDVAGNTGIPSAALTVIVDRLNSAPVVGGLTPGTDTGVSDHDGITANASPTVLGTADPGVEVTVIIDGVDHGPVIAGASGTWSLSLVGFTLADGTHQVGARALDLAGNSTTSVTTYPLRIGTSISDPAISALAPDTGASASDRITYQTAPTITGSGVAGAVVAVTRDGLAVGSTTVSAQGVWTLTLPAVSDGTYTLIATQTDVFGNSGTSLSVSYQVDTLAPTAPTLAGLAPDTGANASDLVTSAVAPILGGNGEVGATITLFEGSVILGTTTVLSDGRWTYRPTLSEGVHALTLTATDVAGNISPASSASSIRIDTTAPLAGQIQGISPDTGRGPADRVTASVSPLVSGIGEVGTVVELYDGTVLVGSAVVANDGTWSITPTLADAIHQLSVVLIDAAGNRSPSSPSVAVTIDTQAPIPPVIQAISNDTGSSASDGVTSDRTVIVSGSAEPGSWVSVHRGDAVLGIVVADAGGNWSLDLSALNLVDGAYPLYATAEDLAGNTSADSAIFTVVVDTAMEVPVILDVTDDTGVLGDHLTANPLPVVAGTAEPGSTVTLTRDGVPVATVVAAADGTWSAAVSPSPLADGAYVLSATAVDVAGNSATGSTWSLTIDATAPTAPVVTAIGDDSGTPGDFLTNDQTLFFYGTAEPGSTVVVSLGGFPIGTAITDALGNWQLDFTGVTLPGDPQLGGKLYTVTAVAIDAAGNTSNPSTEQVIGIDSGVSSDIALITVITDSGIIGDQLTNDTSVTIVGVAEPGSIVEVFDGSTSLGTTIAGVFGLWSLDALFPAGDAIHPLTATATDLADNVSGPSVVMNLHIDTVAPPAPVVTAMVVDSGLVGDFVSNDPTQVFQGTAEPFSTVTVRLGGVAIGSVTTSAAGFWEFDFTAVTLPDATYQLTASATDIAGNAGVSSAAQAIVIDTRITDPLLLGSGIDSGIVGDLVTNHAQQTITGQGEPGSLVTVSIDGVAQAPVILVAADGTWSFGPTSVLTDGTHVFTAVATDTAGNISSVSPPLTVVIDTLVTAPTVTSLSPGTITGPVTAITGSSSPFVTGHADPYAVVEIRIDGVSVATVVADQNGDWSYTATGLAAGDHQVVLTSWDLAGNSAATTVLTLTVDQTPPNSTLITAVFAEGVTIPENSICQDRTPLIQGSGEPGAGIEIFADGLSLGTTVVAGDGRWSFTPGTDIVADGLVVLTAVATDAQGNVGTASPPWRVTILLTRSVEIQADRCGVGSNFALIGILLAAFLRLSWTGRTRSALSSRWCGLLLLVLVLSSGVAAQAEDLAAPEPFRYGAKFEVLRQPTEPAPLAEATPVVLGREWQEWREVRLTVTVMPDPDQAAAYVRGSHEPGSSTWDTTIRADVSGYRQGQDFAWGGLMLGASLGYFQVRGEESASDATSAAYQYRINTLPLDIQAGVRLDLTRNWWCEGRGILGLGLTRITIDAPASGAGNLEAASGSSFGLYTEYGLALALGRQMGQWKVGLETRYLWARHSGAFERNEYLGGTLVQHEEHEIRLEQTGLAYGLSVGRRF